ncbi:Ig-like domain-containing protein [Tundrisphaera lichenicola]|uniref:Ig-like domain-containing protein n=1 Tax=Tundrisphaera lichenicola TaxID=2029860 RepID=UPI003EC01D66
MASFKGNGRDEASKRRAAENRRLRQGRPNLESLEQRRLLAAPWVPTSNDPYDVQNGPLANLGQDLITVYKEYNEFAKQGNGQFHSSLASRINFYNGDGPEVDIDVYGSGDFASFRKSLENLGLFVVGANQKNFVVEGYVPIATLPQIARLNQTISASPVYTPITHTEGSANNQGDLTLSTSTIRLQNPGIDGTGVGVGVISDSVNNFQGGLADSVASGDLPSNVTVVQDAPAAVASTDEGRAMLELVHDIAPGSPLAFATGALGQVSFASNIQALAAAGSNVVVDDLTYANEPYFQDGVISQSINTFVGNGGIYASSAANFADSGYMSEFRGVNATVGAIGSGRFQNFDGTGQTVAPTIGINVYRGGTAFIFQYDQPFNLAGGGVSSNLDFYLLDTSGNIVGSSLSNNIATNQPIEGIFTDTSGNPIAAGLYQLAIRVASGPDPTHVVVYDFGGGFSVDKQYGSSGGTYYPSTSGHNSGANTISVGAVPYWGAQPFTSPTTVNNEPFSSTGPRLITFNPDGSPITPQLLLKPDISAPDGGNTSFFVPNSDIDTTNPPFPTAAFPPYPGSPQTLQGNPVTATNLDPDTLPNFFGTSAAAPNLAALLALMKQANPGATQANLLSAVQQTATPLNGATAGTWNPQGGYGLANGPAAFAVASKLKVVYISPGAGQTITKAPTSITVTFNKAVDITTINPGEFQVRGANGATVDVGLPIGVDDPRYATTVRFPIVIHPAPGKIANGEYTTLFFTGSIMSVDGQTLEQGAADKFNLQQLNGPRITNTSFNNRVATITFDGPIDPATINSGNIILFRAGDSNNTNYYGPNQVILTNQAGSRITYNPANLTVTIDLTGVSQLLLPTDRYALIVTTGVHDAVGNSINGQFSGVFPSGIPNGNGTQFFQGLGLVTLFPPQVASLTLAPQSDSGIQGDNNTSNKTPSYVGQVTSSFPGSLAGVIVYAQFNGISHPGVARGDFNLGVGAGGRGITGQFDVQTVTDANGRFVINYPSGVTGLPEGQNQIRVVVVGQSEQPSVAGYASSQDAAFRVDNTLPYVGTTDNSPATSIPQNSNINSLSNLSINIVDPVNPTLINDPFAVDPSLGVPALDPVKASNTQNYRLFQVVNGNRVDRSSFLKTATYVSTSNRVLSSDPYTGRIDFTFNPGLPTGNYQFEMIAASFQPGVGLTDAAGNAFAGYADRSSLGQAFNYRLDFSLQPTPAYITSFGAFTPSGAGFIQTDARATYEIPINGVTPRATAAPTVFVIDFSNTLQEQGVDLNNAVQLLRSANGTGQLPDGNFGDLGITSTGNGYTRVPNVSVRVDSSVKGSVPGQYGYRNQLVISLPQGTTLSADYYRLYLPNSGANTLTDIFGNQLDGEFKGYKDANGTYVNLLPNGQVRGTSAMPDLSGDGIAGGAFMTGFVVVPNGNILYARADAQYNPLLPSQTPTGAIDKPFPVLAAESVFTSTNGGNLNSSVNSGSNFNPAYDRSGDGKFEPSAFYAAQQLVQANGGPVVIIAQASIPTPDAATGRVIQKPFVLQAPAGIDANINDGSAAIPALTTLAFQPGSILKMQNASLLVQNQGSALQILGGSNPGQGVTITSYKDSTIGGVTNGDPSTVGAPGDYGGILFRNYSQANRNTLFPGQLPITANASINQKLKGQFANPGDPASQVDAISGADDVMSYVSFLNQRYAGGAVPQTVGFRYDGITLKNSRPTIVNSSITDTNGSDGTAQAGISVDVDSLRADDIAQGPLIRNDSFLRNGLNGIYIRAESSGIAEATNAVSYPNNPSTAGGARNYVLDDPYPYLLTSRLVLGQSLVQETGGTQANLANRLYINPGMILKFSRGSSLELVNSGASLNVGDQTYIREFDANNSVGPNSPGFVANSPNLAQAILTSINDDAATTFFFDPISQIRTTIVQPLPAVPGGSGILQPKPGAVPDAARWGGVTVASGAVAVINSTNLRYGGGSVNSGSGTGTQHVLELLNGNSGAKISVTNNVFSDNADAPINAQPNSFLAADPQRPLQSGNPFIHGNVFTGNDLNGVSVQGGTDGINRPNLTVDSVWAGSDFTYILRNTIVLAGFNTNSLPNGGDTAFQAIPSPAITLTLQSTLQGTVLADGSTVGAPGVPLIVKLLNPTGTTLPAIGDAEPAAAITNSFVGGAGFLVGVDNGVDPTADSLIDPGAFSQLRILGIGANQTTGQSRVPVIITSLFDDTVGTTVNNVPMFQAVSGNTRAPAAGDGGVIYYGANSLTDYDLQDPRSGSVIDNADIKYITRIEQQGSGLVYAFDSDLSGGFDPILDGYSNQKLGLIPETQINQAKQLTISNSNLSTFSSAAFWAHIGYAPLVIPVNYPVGPPSITRGGFQGEATHTYFVNNSISNMPQGILILSQTANNDQFTSPAMAVFLNNTFYNITGNAIRTVSPAFNGLNSLAHTAFLAMDNIFSLIGGSAAVSVGQNYGSDLQYNLFDRVSGPFTVNVSNSQPVTGNPAFRDAPNGNFNLLPTSAAIDLGRSELGPSVFGNMIFPASTINPNNINAIPIRNTQGASIRTGGIFPGNAAGTDIVTLPGEPVSERGFPDQWVPVLQTAAPNATGTGKNAATFVYVPLQGERDQAGNLRVKDPNSPNVGFGSRPFFDLGAFEYIIQNPPVVTAVQAVAMGIATNLYVAGGIAGTNKTPSSVQVKFNERIDPNTISGSSVILQASGGDGIFGNANSPADRNINLSGLLTIDPITNTLSIDTSSILANPATLNDEYRLILKGTGSSIIRDLDGLALDGFTANQTLPLPSGSDNVPGSDFLVNFTISTNSPSVNAGTFQLASASDTSGGRNITRLNLPTFVGSITDMFPPTNFLQNQSVHIDISSKGDGNFDIIDAGVGTTLADGSFSVTLTKPIPDTPNSVGTNGIKGGPGATYAIARVRVINQAGNPSNLPTDPLSDFVANNAVTRLQVDTTLPVITSFSPLANTVATLNSSGGITFTMTLNENIRGSSLNSSSIQVFRSGGTGVFGATSIAIPINRGSFTASYNSDGSEVITFQTSGVLPNDAYQIILKGTGSSPVTDIAGNPLSGAFSGTFPTGSGNTASDFINTPFTVYRPNQANLIYVRAPRNGQIPTSPDGSRSNPFATIADGMAAALVGDNVLVLPGTYTENVVVKPGVRLLSASTSSTDSSYIPGLPNQTLIYGDASASSTMIYTVSVSGGFVGTPTEVSGFSIISPLIGDPTLGTINTTNVAVFAQNSNVVIDRNNIINAGVGVSLSNTGTNKLAAQVFDNVIAGNIVGVGITGNGGSSLSSPYLIVNNTIVDNTYGLLNSSSTANALQAFVLNNIFAANHALTTARTGTGIQSNTANTLGVGFNLFYSNGPSAASSADDAVGSFGSFRPSALTNLPDGLGNFTGDPAFASARDPRPNGDSPPVFFLDGNYDLTARSVAINAGNNAVSPATDFLYRAPVKIAGKGFANTGPASIGAYYYKGTGGPTAGGGTGSGSGGLPINLAARTAATAAVQSGVVSSIGGGAAIGTKKFNVIETSLSTQGTSSASDVPGVVASEAAPSFIDINFSNYIDASTLTPSDLVLSGSGIDPANPAHATGLTWIDGHAVRFLLSGAFRNGGNVNVSIAPGAVSSDTGTLLAGYNDIFKVASGGTSSNQGSVAIPIQPVPVSGPVAVGQPGGKQGRSKAAKAAYAAQLAQEAKVKKEAQLKAARQAAAAKHDKVTRAAKAKKTK